MIESYDSIAVGLNHNVRRTVSLITTVGQSGSNVQQRQTKTASCQTGNRLGRTAVSSLRTLDMTRAMAGRTVQINSMRLEYSDLVPATIAYTTLATEAFNN